MEILKSEKKKCPLCKAIHTVETIRFTRCAVNIKTKQMFGYPVTFEYCPMTHRLYQTDEQLLENFNSEMKSLEDAYNKMADKTEAEIKTVSINTIDTINTDTDVNDDDKGTEE